MALVLTLERPDAAAERRRLDGGRLTIGRSADNDWVVHDPERVLSKHHCAIEQRDGAWLLTDTSANGVFLGDAENPIGQGRSVPLQDGQVLRLGGFRLRVGTEGGQHESAMPSAAAAFAGEGLFDRSWCGGKQLDAPAHPLRDEPARTFTRPDHVPHDAVALDLPRRPSPFDEPPAPPAAERSPTAGPVPSPEPAAVAAARQDLLDAFLEGAGLTRADAAGQDPAALLRALGARYRIMAGGLVELLEVRAALKREVGMDRTRISASGNNPLKLTASAEEAVRWLVHPRGAGYLAPDPAIAAAVDDLKAFMPELVQAMQAALRKLVRRFEPSELERAAATATSLALLAAGGRKARLWDLFKERYAELAGEAEAEFLRDVGVAIDRRASDGGRR